MKYSIYPIEFKSIKEMPAEIRPRERMASCGPFHLSDLELVCILLGSGNNNRPVQDIAQDILEVVDRNRDREHLLKELTTISGLGNAKASTILAGLELGRRLSSLGCRRYATPAEIFSYVRHYGDRKQEHFICIQLNGALEILAADVITVGLINKTLVHPREVFAPAILNRATSVVFAHNHPSGNLEFSYDDIELTSQLVKAGKILGIQVADHIVFSMDGYNSMNETGQFYFT